MQRLPFPFCCINGIKLKNMKNIRIALMGMLIAGSLVACAEETPKNETPEMPENQTEAAIDTAKEKIEEAASATLEAGKEVANDAADVAKEVSGKAVEAGKEVIEKGAEKVETAAKEVKEEVKK